jgi:predicted NBD/HSP70 family sugar kinase
MSTTSPTAGSVATLRRANQRRVLGVLLERSPDRVTQADLARETGLAAGTVSSIVRALAAADVVATVAGAGRRGTTVQLARGAGLVAGVDFGHNHLAVAVADMAGALLAEAREPIDSEHAHDEGLARAQQLLDQVLGQADVRRSEIRTIGMGLPAPISDGVVMHSAILPGWTGVNAMRVAGDALHCPVVVENDANLGALAEHHRGAGRGAADMVFVKVSSGVGAGLIIDHELFRGSGGTAGEIGHLTLDEQGPLCRCGSRGCLEAYAKIGTVLEMMAPHLPGADLAAIIEAAHQGNVAALRVFEDAGLHLGWGLAALTNLLNPAVIVIGGDLAHAGDLLLESARRGLRRHVLAGAATTPVTASELGDKTSLVGAVLLAVESTDLLAGRA